MMKTCLSNDGLLYLNQHCKWKNSCEEILIDNVIFWWINDDDNRERNPMNNVKGIWIPGNIP